MGMTMTQKILAAHAGLESVTAGQLIEAKLDVVMANDITGPMALPILKEMSDTVFDKDKVVFVPDHFTPNKTSNPQKILKQSVNLQRSKACPGILSRANPVWSMPSCPRQESWQQASALSAQIRILVHTAPWGHFLQG